MKSDISVIIVNYNGRALLMECMPSIMEAADASGLPCEIIVVDNASQDDSVNFLREEYKRVRVLTMQQNNHWFSINEGIKASSSDHLLLLNNDIRLERDCMTYLLGHFKSDDAIFAVTPKEMSWDGRDEQKGAQALEMKNEAICQSVENYYFESPHVTFKADNSMYSKDKLIRLGLFDPIFAPFYYEDSDLSYRAWKSGYRIIYEPRAVIYHKRGASINRYMPESAKMVYSFKNSLLFIWKNVTDRGLLLRHLFFLTIRFLKAIVFFRSRRFVLKGTFLAIKSVRGVCTSRKDAIRSFVLTDREVLDRLDARRFNE